MKKLDKKIEDRSKNVGVRSKNVACRMQNVGARMQNVGVMGARLADYRFLVLLFMIFVVDYFAGLGNSGAALAAGLFGFGLPQIMFDEEVAGGAPSTGSGTTPSAPSAPSTPSTGSGTGSGTTPSAPSAPSTPSAPSAGSGTGSGSGPEVNAGMSLLEEARALTAEKYDKPLSEIENTPPPSTPSTGSGTGSGDSPQGENGGAPEVELPEGMEFADGYGTPLVEVEGMPYFYHPEVHGKDTGQANTFKDREAAETAASAKAFHIAELVNKLTELGTDVGAVTLPDWISGPADIEGIEKAADMEHILTLKDDDLRSFITEADTLITHLGKREKTVSETAEREARVTAVEARQQELTDRLLDTVETLGLTTLVAQKPSFDVLKAKIEEGVSKKIDAELKPLITAHNALKSDEEARYSDDFADKLEQSLRDIEAKKTELTTAYESTHLALLDEIGAFNEEAEQLKNESPEVSEKARLEKINKAFIGLQGEKKDSEPMFMTGNPNATKAFEAWAMNRVADYGGLQTVYEWNRALNDYKGFVKEKSMAIKLKQKQDAQQQRAQAQQRVPPYGTFPTTGDGDRPIGKHSQNEAILEEARSFTTRKYAK